MSNEKVKKLLASQLNVGVDTINDSSKIVEDLGADSLDMIEMLMSLEEQFGIAVSDEEAEKLKTVGDVVALIDGKVNK